MSPEEIATHYAAMIRRLRVFIASNRQRAREGYLPEHHMREVARITDNARWIAGWAKRKREAARQLRDWGMA